MPNLNNIEDQRYKFVSLIGTRNLRTSIIVILDLSETKKIRKKYKEIVSKYLSSQMYK